MIRTDSEGTVYDGDSNGSRMFSGMKGELSLDFISHSLSIY
jgi:hypothetical protein